MRKVIVICVVAAAVFAGGYFLIGCEPKVDSGTVTAKKYEPARSYVMFMPIYTTTCGAKGSCTTTLAGMIPYVIYDGEDYKLTLRDCSGEKCRKGTAYVDAKTFAATKVGQFFGATENQLADNNNRKRKKNG